MVYLRSVRSFSISSGVTSSLRFSATPFFTFFTVGLKRFFWMCGGSVPMAFSTKVMLSLRQSGSNLMEVISVSRVALAISLPQAFRN